MRYMFSSVRTPVVAAFLVAFACAPIAAPPASASPAPAYGQEAPATGDAVSAEGKRLSDEGTGESYAAAVGKFEEAARLYEREGDRLGQARSLGWAGFLSSALGEKAKALGYFEQALPIVRAVGDRGDEATTLKAIGDVYFSLGEKAKALGYYEQALALRRAVGDRGGEATTLTAIGSVYNDLGEKAKALGYYEQALPLFQAVGDREGEPAALIDIGTLYLVLGEKAKAYGYYEQALLLYEAVGNRGGEAMTLTAIGLVCSSQGEAAKALGYFEHALGLYRAVGHRRGEATSLNNIGTMYFVLGEKWKALGYYGQALLLWRAMGDPTGEAGTLIDIGKVHNDLGDKATALGYYEQALPLLSTVGNRGDKAMTLTAIGWVYDNLGEKAKALGYYEQALLLWRALGNRGLEATTLWRCGDLWSRHHNPRLATLYAKQAVNIVQSLRADISSLEREIQQTFLKSKADLYRFLADLLVAEGRLPEAEQVLRMLKEEEYFDFVRRDPNVDALMTRADLTPHEADALRRYAEKADRITALGSRWAELSARETLSDDEKAEFDRVSKDLEAANTAFAVFLRQLADEFAKRPAARTADDVAETTALMSEMAAWGEGVVLLQTILGDEAYRVIVTTPNAQLARSHAIPIADLNAKIEAFRRAVTDPKADPRPAGLELYKIVVGPIEKDLEGAGARTLVWSLDGALRYVPVGALWDGREYVAERYETVVVTLASRSRMGERRGPATRGLGLGVSTGVGGFAPLPAVEAELRAIIREQGAVEGVLPGRVLLNGAFKEAEMLAALKQQYPVVHIASHFRFRPGNETDSALLMGDGSGLTLERIRDYPGAGIFAGVDLLTLSACETAMAGGGTGAEVEGFGVLAQRKGARAIVASLWPVADASTAELMREMYRILGSEGEETRIGALRRAQLRLLRGETAASGAGLGPRGVRPAGAEGAAGARFVVDPKRLYAHPYYWAPFILIGNWR
jgi:CHAT domain-containing protein